MLTVARPSGRIMTFFIGMFAFFAPWGEGLQQATRFDLSKIFVALIAVFIVLWLVFGKERLVFPDYFNWFILFVLAHTLVTYGLFFGRDFTFGPSEEYVIGKGFSSIEGARGVIVVRRVLLILFGYALASQLVDFRRVAALLTGYGAGLCTVMLMGGYRMFDNRFTEERIAGGVINPNAFALSGLTLLFLGTAAAFRTDTKPLFRALSLFFIAVGLGVIFGSGCRGAMTGAFAGGLLLLYRLPGIGKKFWLVLGGLAAVIAVVNFFPRDFSDTLRRRFDYQRIQADGGAGRTFIWRDYLKRFPAYALTGVGMARAQEVTRYSWTRKWAVTHNNYLGTWVEFGVIGMLLYLMALFQMGKSIAERRQLDERQTVLSAAFEGMFAAWLVMSFFMDTFSQRESWIILGLIAAYGRIPAEAAGVKDAW